MMFHATPASVLTFVDDLSYLFVTANCLGDFIPIGSVSFDIKRVE